MKKVRDAITQHPSRQKIASTLNISPKKVGWYLSRLYARYKVHSLVEMALLLYDRELNDRNRKQLLIEEQYRQLDVLSPSERAIVELLRKGMSNRRIAEQLRRSPKGIRSQMWTIGKKTGLSRVELAFLAHQRFLLGQP
jgi:DNA-binding NarL/FixJ family response regulator